MQFMKLPVYFVIHLKRFNNLGVKNVSNVSFPKIMDLSKYVYNEDAQNLTANQCIYSQKLIKYKLLQIQ